MPAALSDLDDDALTSILEAAFALVQHHRTQGALQTLGSFGPLLAEARFPVDMQAVSARFCRLTRHLPVLWTTLVDSMPADAHSEFLARSALQPLTVVVLSLPSERDPRLDAFLHMALLHRRRWRAIYIHIPDGRVREDPFRDVEDIPVLETVIIMGGSLATGNRLVIDSSFFLARLSMPCLTLAALGHARSSDARLESLRSLVMHIHQPPDGLLHPSRPHTGVATLLGSDMDVWVAWRSFDELHGASLKTKTLVCLNALQSLTISMDTPIAEAAWFFSALHCPRLQSLSIRTSTKVAGWPVEALLEYLFSAGALGCGSMLRELTVVGSEAELAPSPEGVPHLEHLFQRCLLATLTRSEFRLSDVRLPLERSPGSAAKIRNLPPTLAVLDMSGVQLVSCRALIRLLGHLCEAGSHATVRIATRSLCWSPHSAEELLYLRRFCTLAMDEGIIPFKVEWLHGPPEILP